MPCCIAIIHYAQCKHNTLFKIGCTDGCEQMCTPDMQERLVLTKYNWRCEDCHYRHTREEDLARELRWEAAVNKVEDEIFDETTQADSHTAEARAFIVDNVRAREEYENELLVQKRGELVDQIHWSEEWTWQYATLLWELRYVEDADEEMTERRRGYLLSVKIWDLTVVREVMRTKDEVAEEVRRYQAIRGGLPRNLHPLLDMRRSPEAERREADPGEARASKAAPPVTGGGKTTRDRPALPAVPLFTGPKSNASSADTASTASKPTDTEEANATMTAVDASANTTGPATAATDAMDIDDAPSDTSRLPTACQGAGTDSAGAST